MSEHEGKYNGGLELWIAHPLGIYALPIWIVSGELHVNGWGVNVVPQSLEYVVAIFLIHMIGLLQVVVFFDEAQTGHPHVLLLPKPFHSIGLIG